MLLMIDNYDSFTWNLVQYFSELGTKVVVYRNDKITLTDIENIKPAYIVISPGPCTPNKAGISIDVIRRFQNDIPILGVCLGHQSIGQLFGGKIIRAKKIMHGKIATIFHNKQGVFTKLPDPMKATCYNSLIIDKDSLPNSLEVTAWSHKEDGTNNEIMGVRHKKYPIEGVQFHPESIMTEHGHDLLNNFLKQ